MYWFIFLLSILLLGILWSLRFRKYQEDLFDWHCTEFFPFHKRFTKLELEYIKHCIQISWYEFFKPFLLLWDEMILNLSFFSYSHRVEASKVNSTRIAYGSLVAPSSAYSYAKRVLKERNITLPFPPGGNFMFNGLGWDFENGHFKVYYRYWDSAKLLPQYKKLITSNETYLKQGLISWTYNQDGVLIETKIYCYPEHEREAHLFSDQRHDIQKDCKKNNSFIWGDYINKTGRDIMMKYGEKNYVLDTITVKDKDHFTLYFPMAY